MWKCISSLGVFKAENRDGLVSIANRLFSESDIILAQKYMYTEFDWRVGILNGRPLFVSKYFMSGKHWQIYRHSKTGKSFCGRTASIPLERTPENVLNIAVRAAALMGDSLYGIDIKETGKGPTVIEINDNPNIESGEEDRVLKDELYRAIIKEFIRKIEC